LPERHVVRNPGSDGGWKVVRPQDEAPESWNATQAEAINEAERLVGRHGGGAVYIHGLDGGLRDRRTIPARSVPTG